MTEKYLTIEVTFHPSALKVPNHGHVHLNNSTCCDLTLARLAPARFQLARTHPESNKRYFGTCLRLQLPRAQTTIAVASRVQTARLGHFWRKDHGRPVPASVGGPCVSACQPVNALQSLAIRCEGSTCPICGTLFSTEHTCPPSRKRPFL